MASKAEARSIGQRLLAAFEAAGAVEVTPDILQPAEALLDLYGEDIRARAYVTADPLRGEMMARPDFTVPVVQAHMAEGAEPARYAYMGEVFRKQDHRGSARVAEYFQAGYEIFDREDPEAADAEVFALFAKLLKPLDLSATIGDIGLLRAAVEGLDTLPARKAALARHIWRPKRFHRLMERYAGLVPVPESRAELLSGATSDAPWIGLRAPEEMAARIAVLQADAETAPIAAEDVARLDALFALRCTADRAPAQLNDLGIAALAPAIARLERRLAALDARGIDLTALAFEASHGRTTMEYYDGFVFSFETADPGFPPIASGGRYDALTRVLGGGREIPAVGGVIRPGLVADLGGLA
ncbi:ATP phosphoribosyltransferase regulatory subunit [Rhodobacter capsulatus]|jgi:ATP phosphoribosyltransferase regulatory subunit|uniref:Histidine--tRNA ligase n=1 Tax=Rhodobacter capsulatus (strain ATCC BAA-309 / NBRC 16581 / SB1003) TaxID=272942 RepID=D5API9_RHOCB|nr:ATP phosphoribosyltransferase regulatory subunit [Rhodobacter capsulatus]ADE84561.1 ATP phosphoribosyltransferase regulatory subunit [Rhodobacter capsulatus SB 1003]ETD02531.1 ATP phosphoribosyltransferase [Rhodobacter capsulatus DE442]ETD78629.1 ATP phosphoribosyltransferase [Rhodobacter capsulatus R121]ETE54595.1 ATP phosphoribosyltransferase [Rhodobacter capsulatus Y262]MDS0926307.1 ATP phosphoribosyltransferase regulatory subunit [Rhodobacter capsulatus]